MELFFHCYHDYGHGSRARAPKDDDDVAQHGGHTPANTKSWFTAYVFDI